ncbi:MAG: STAS domain-containing protein [Prevotella sp.]|jgi:anti-sigma B factor antagonist|nr:STAS domain-containing protein [Prevotella sp.]
MTTNILEKDGALVAEFKGRLDTAAAPQVESEVKPLMEASGKDVILDCTELSYISSSGLRIFLSILKTVKPKGAHVYITGMNNDLRNVFTMTGFINLFEFK